MGDIALGENMRSGNTARVGAMRVRGSRVGAVFADLSAGFTNSLAAWVNLPIHTWDFPNTAALVRATALSGYSTESKLGILSFWFRSDAASATRQFFVSSGTGTSTVFNFSLRSDGRAEALLFNSAFTQIGQADSGANVYENDSNWHHYLCSWDLGNNAIHLLIDGADVVATSSVTDDSVGTSSSVQTTIGSRSNEDPNSTFEGQMGQVYLNLSEYLDFSVAANVLLFISAVGGIPVYLGATGTTPTGNQPIILVQNTVPAITANDGSGGNFSSITGVISNYTATNPGTSRTALTVQPEYPWQQQHQGGVKRMDTNLADTAWTVSVGAP